MEQKINERFVKLLSRIAFVFLLLCFNLSKRVRILNKLIYGRNYD